MSDNAVRHLTTPRDSDTATLARLHGTLLERARTESSLDVAFAVIDSPVGRLLVAGTGSGLVRVAFENEGHDAVLDALGSAIGSRILKDAKGFDEVHRELDDYFDGRRQTFDLPVDLRLAHGFRLDILRHLREIPYGHTESYGTVAARAGSPRASRAVGSACATNPLPIVIPCHRVVRSDGSMGGYLGGTATKEWLLALEAA